MDALQMKAFGIEAAKAAKDEAKKAAFKGKPPTKPKPFALTSARPRVAPDPIKIEQQSYAKPVPRAMLQRTSVKQLDAEATVRAEETRKATESKYSPSQEFHFHDSKSRVLDLRAQLEEEQMAHCRVQFKSKPAPGPPTEAEVKLNAASIIREDALYKRKQATEAATIKAYESELRDSTEFYRWQTEMRRRDEKVKFDKVEEVRVDMAATRRRAIKATTDKRDANAREARKMKKQGVIDEGHREEEAKDLINFNKRLVKDVIAVRETAPQIAKDKVKVARVARRNLIHEETLERETRKAEELRVEQVRRDDLIRQIRAVERVPKVKVTMFDPTESAGQGLLEEMSLVELRERMQIVKMRDVEVVEERRQGILGKKKKQEEAMKARIVNIRKIRRAAAAENVESRRRRDIKAREVEVAKKKVRDAGNVKLADKLEAQWEARDAEQQSLRDEEAKLAKVRMFLGAEAAMVEVKRFESQLEGGAREAYTRQSAKQVEAQTGEVTKALEQRIRRANAREAARVEQAEVEQKAAAVKVRAVRTNDKAFVETQRKKDKFRVEKRRERQLTQKLKHENLYADSMNARTLVEGQDEMARREENLDRYKLGVTRKQESRAKDSLYRAEERLRFAEGKRDAVDKYKEPYADDKIAARQVDVTRHEGLVGDSRRHFGNVSQKLTTMGTQTMRRQRLRDTMRESHK
jgi:hypothetical protein